MRDIRPHAMHLPSVIRFAAFALLAAPSLLFANVVYDPGIPSVIFWGHDIYNGTAYSVSSGQTLQLILPTGYSNANQVGVISGDGHVSVQSELRTILFTANHTYTGQTGLVAYTVLQIGDGGAYGSLASPVVNMDRAYLRFNRSDAFIFGSNIDGTGEIRQQGSGTTILTGNVSLGARAGAPMDVSGVMTITGGALQIGNGGTAGSVDAVGIVNQASLIFNRSDAYTFSDPISGTGSVTQNGAGVLTLSGTNTYAGGTTVNAGRIHFSSLANLGSGAITLNGGGLQWASGTTTDVSSRLAALGASGATFDTNGNNVTFGSSLSGAGSLTKTGAGTLTLAGTNTYAGNTSLNGGLVNFSSLSSLGSGAITINGGGLQWAAGNTTDLTASARYDRVVGAAGATFDTNGNNVAFASALSGSGGLIKAGSGTLTLAAANTYSGGTTINGGTLQIGNGGSTGSIAGNIVDNGNLTFNRSDAVTFSGLISGSGSLTQSGAGTLTLTTANTYSGGTVLNAGTLGLGANNVLGTGAITINGGNLRAVGSARTLTNAVTFNGDFTLGRLTNLAGAITLTKDTTLTSANPGTSAATTSTLSGVISGSYGLTFAEGVNPIGTIVLSGANTHTGNTTLQAGALTIAHSLALQNSTFDYAGGTFGFGTLTNATFGGLKGSQSLALTNNSSGAVALTVGGNNASALYSGILSGGGSLTKNGTGTLTLSSANTYSGGTTVNAGLLAFSSLASFGSGALTFNGGGLQWASGNTTDITTLVNTVGATGATFDTGGNQVTFANGLAGSGSLTKAGTGTLTLVAANSYTGATTVSGGTLALSGSGTLSTAALYLTNGGTLDLGGKTQTFSGLGTSANRLVGHIANGTVTTTGNTYLQSGTYANTFTGSSANGRLWIGGDSAATVTLSGTNDAVYTSDHNQVIIGHSTTGAAGTVKLDHANALAAATENVEVWTGTLDLNGQANVRANSITLADDVASRLVNNNTASAASYAGTVYLNNDGYVGPVSQVGGTGQLTLSGTLVGTVLNKTGAGTLTLANDTFFTHSAYPVADYGRQITVAGGTLSLGGSTPSLDFGYGVGFTFSNNSKLRFSTSGDVTYTGGSYSAQGAYATLRFETTGQNITLSDAYLAAYQLEKTGAGTLTLGSTGAGSYNHDFTYVSGGTLALTQAGQLGRYGFIIGNDAALDLGGSTQSLTDPSAYIDIARGTVANGTLAFDGEIYVTGGATFNATLTGSGDSARLWLDSYSGDTIHLGGSNDRVATSDHNQVVIGSSWAGTVKLLTPTALAAATENVEIWTGTLDLNGQTGVRANSLVLRGGSSSGLVNGSAAAASFAGGVTLETGSAQLGGAGNLTLSGILSGAGGLNKTGGGTLTLSGANTYTGATSVTAGELRLNGSAANSAFTVGGGILSGSGTAGTLIIANGGTLSPGNSPGILTAGSTTFEGGGSFEFELNNATGSAGTSYDLLAITGSLNLTATSANPFTLEVVSLTLANDAGLAANFNAASDYAFTFVTTTTGISGFAADKFTIDTSGFTNPFDGSWAVALANGGNALALTYTAAAIPEPSTYAIIAGLVCLAVALGRRRSAK